MDIVRAKEIVFILAEGVDPTTGEIFPCDSVYNKGDIVRALYAVLRALDEKKNSRPENAGKAWTKEDDAKLGELFQANTPKREICRFFQRSEGAIAARLVRLGLIEERDTFRNRR